MNKNMTPSEHYKARLRRAPAPPTEAKSSGGVLPVFKNAALAVAILSAVGALFGYGVSLGLSGTFGYSSGVWYSTTIELLSLCGEGFLGAISALSLRFDYGKLLAFMMAFGAALAALTLAVLMLSFLIFSQAHRISKWRTSTWNWLAKPKSEEAGRISLNAIQRAFAAVFAAGVVGTAAPLAVGIAFTVVITVISAIPLLGFSAGTAYATDVVLGPMYCVSSIKVRTKIAKLPKTEKKYIGADCVEVTNADTGETFSGRLVISRPTHVVLYRPKQDDVIVVVIKTGSMKTIETLD